MPLVKEDGTGLATANSYATVAELDLFLAERQVTAWDSANTATKERCAIEAAEYLDNFYSWKGDELTEDQALAWPREDYDEIPTNVTKAHALLSAEALTGPLAPSITGAEVASVSESLSGVGSTSTTYRQGRDTSERRFPLIDKLLKGLTTDVPGDGVTTIRRTM